MVKQEAEVARPKDHGEQSDRSVLLANGESRMPTRGCWPPAKRSNAATTGQDEETYLLAAFMHTLDE